MMHHSLVALVASVLAASLLPASASAQPPPDITQRAALGAQVPQPPVRLWSVSIATGSASGRSSQELEAAMRAGGFDDRTPDVLVLGRDHPYSDVQGRADLLTIRRRFGKMAHIRAVMGRSNPGKTHGFTLGPPEWGWVYVKQSVSTYAIMAGINTEADGGFWVAGGPALYRVAFEHGATDIPYGTAVTANRLGAVVALGLVLPARKRLFVELQSQYRLVGTADLGPIDVAGISGAIAGTLPRTKVNLNHHVVLLGLGVRL